MLQGAIPPVAENAVGKLLAGEEAVRRLFAVVETQVLAGAPAGTQSLEVIDVVSWLKRPPTWRNTARGRKPRLPARGALQRRRLRLPHCRRREQGATQRVRKCYPAGRHTRPEGHSRPVGGAALLLRPH